MISSKRFEEALEWLGRGGRLPRHDSAGLKAKCLVSLGRRAEARELLWQDYLQTLSDSSFTGALKLTSQEDTEARKQEAIEAAKKHGSALTALSFLLKQDFKSEAALFVLDRWQELNGDHYHALRPAAEKLEKDFPLAAVLLRRRLVEAILEKGISKYYAYAVTDLRRTALVSQLVQDWQSTEDHEQYILRLRARHGKKAAFWTRYDEVEK